MIQGRGTIAERVIQRVADADNCDMLELPPLSDATDPDALETFIEKTSSGEVSFLYAGYEVSVESDGTITIAKPFTRGDTAKMTAVDG